MVLDVRYKKKKKLPVQEKISKLVLYVLLILAPLLLIMAVFAPIAQRMQPKTIFDYYKLPADYTKKDIVDLVRKMSKDKEFGFYFFLLEDAKIKSATLEIWEILRDHGTASKLYNQLDKAQGDVVQIAELFLRLEYPEEFFEKPEEYEQLSDAIWQFVYEEFKLAILGVCYKVTFDPLFRFTWDVDTQQAAKKLSDTVFRLIPEDEQLRRVLYRRDPSP